ncbi:MAG: hypothetical protein ACOCP8_02425 [archaeon]
MIGETIFENENWEIKKKEGEEYFILFHSNKLCIKYDDIEQYAMRIDLKFKGDVVGKIKVNNVKYKIIKEIRKVVKE